MKITTTNYAQLFVWTDIDPAYEDDFNLWYDSEHMEERVAIEGFQWARRYRNTASSERRYLAIYRTQNIGTFSTPSYAKAFAHQTAWSNTNFARMQNTKRRVMHIPAECGFGTGASAALVSFPTLGLSAADLEKLAAPLADIPGVLGYHLMDPDDALSTPLPSENPEGRSLETALLIDATTSAAAQAAGAALLELFALPQDRLSLFDFIWELRSEDLEKTTASNAA